MQKIAILCVTTFRRHQGVTPEKAEDRSSINNQHTISYDHLHDVAPLSYFNTDDVHSLVIHSHTSSVSTNDLVCRLCSSIVDHPIQLTTCNRLVCMRCLW